MTARPRALGAAPAELAELRQLLERVLGELLELRAEVRGLKRSAASVPALVVAIEEYFGPGRFTVRGLLDLAESEPHGAIADAVAAVVDLSASRRSRATALGALLSRLPEQLEVVAEQRGVAVYRLRTCAG